MVPLSTPVNSRRTVPLNGKSNLKKYNVCKRVKNISPICGEPAISLHSHHVSIVQWTTRLLPITRDPGSKPLGDLYETGILLLAMSRYTFTYSVYKFGTVCVMYVHTVEVTVVFFCPTYCCSQLNGSDLARRPISQASGVCYGKTLMVCNDNSWQSRF